jgi:hypothetical protein
MAASAVIGMADEESRIQRAAAKESGNSLILPRDGQRPNRLPPTCPKPKAGDNPKQINAINAQENLDNRLARKSHISCVLSFKPRPDRIAETLDTN